MRGGNKDPNHGTRFQPGNPGRPLGVRHKLTELFFKDLLSDWEQHGNQALMDAREQNPVGYLGVVARLMPAKLEVEKVAGQISDAELIAIIRGAEPAALPAPNVQTEGRA